MLPGFIINANLYSVLVKIFICIDVCSHNCTQCKVSNIEQKSIKETFIVTDISVDNKCGYHLMKEDNDKFILSC